MEKYSDILAGLEGEELEKAIKYLQEKELQ